MDIEKLNEGCPFGQRSTNFYSKRGEAPNLKEAQQANVLIKGILGEFVQFLGSTSVNWTLAPIGLYDEWGRKSVVISETVPESLKDVYPVNLDRSADALLQKLRASDLRAIKAIMQLHGEIFSETKSHMQAAGRVMHWLKDHYVPIFCEGLFSGNPVEDGLPVSDELWQLAVAYQNLQERCSSTKEVERINALLQVRPEIIPNLLGVQVELCKRIEEFLIAHPKFRGGTIAFSEIALWNENTGEMTPSTRLLKLLLHNWGKYFLEKPTSFLGVMIRHALRRALEDEIYHQNIFIFRRLDDSMRLYGVTSKVCPARLAVGKMMLHYFPE